MSKYMICTENPDGFLFYSEDVFDSQKEAQEALHTWVRWNSEVFDMQDGDESGPVHMQVTFRHHDIVQMDGETAAVCTLPDEMISRAREGRPAVIMWLFSESGVSGHTVCFADSTEQAQRLLEILMDAKRREYPGALSVSAEEENRCCLTDRSGVRILEMQIAQAGRFSYLYL